jgi:uncharacterized protein (TIGR02466 family)
MAMFQNSQVMPLFAVPVWAQQLDDELAATTNAHLLQQVDVLKAALPGTLAPGQEWQTRNDLHTLPAFSGMKDIILGASERVLGMLKVAPAPYEITGCWMNIKPRGSGHTLHSHANNYLSGVYYARAPEGADNITFHDFRMDRQVIVPRYTEPTPLTMHQVQVPVKTGVLIMFPGWLPHSVAANPTDAERVSLSFNIMFSDFAATLSKPHWDWAAEEMGQSVNS